MKWDVFVSHASEDKRTVVEPLCEILKAKGLQVWYDKLELTMGDSLRRKIDEGLAQSDYGVVVLSKDFFRKDWPQKELDGLVAREDGKQKRILPVWHGVFKEDVARSSPILADRLAVTTDRGLEHVANEIVRAIQVARATGKAIAPTPATGKATAVPTLAKKRSNASKAKTKKTGPHSWIMLDDRFFPAKSVRHQGDDTIVVEIVPSTGEQQADLDALKPAKYGGSRKMSFASDKNGCVVKVKDLHTDFSGGQTVYNITLSAEQRDLGIGVGEATYIHNGKTYTPDDIAQRKAGRILANNPPYKDPRGLQSLTDEGMLESHIEVRECAIQKIYREHPDEPNWKEWARLRAVYLLKTSGAVDDVLDLKLGQVRDGKVQISFRGRRRARYQGLEPTTISINEPCPLGATT